MIKIMKPIFVLVNRVPVLNVDAITLWPIVLIRRDKDDACLRVHETYHWQQAFRFGVLPWYAAYLLIGIFYIGKPADTHPLERGAYEAERRCRKSYVQKTLFEV